MKRLGLWPAKDYKIYQVEEASTESEVYVLENAAELKLVNDSEVLSSIIADLANTTKSLLSLDFYCLSLVCLSPSPLRPATSPNSLFKIHLPSLILCSKPSLFTLSPPKNFTQTGNLAYEVINFQ